MSYLLHGKAVYFCRREKDLIRTRGVKKKSESDVNIRKSDLKLSQNSDTRISDSETNFQKNSDISGIRKSWFFLPLTI